MKDGVEGSPDYLRPLQNSRFKKSVILSGGEPVHVSIHEAPRAAVEEPVPTKPHVKMAPENPAKQGTPLANTKSGRATHQNAYASTPRNVFLDQGRVLQLRLG